MSVPSAALACRGPDGALSAMMFRAPRCELQPGLQNQQVVPGRDLRLSGLLGLALYLGHGCLCFYCHGMRESALSAAELLSCL